MAAVAPSEVASDVEPTIALTSDAFPDGELMPQRYTCDGTGANPPLRWGEVPDGTAEVVVVVEDPDAVDGTFVHWMIADLKPVVPGVLEEDSIPEGAKVGLNDFGAAAYGAPCPPHDHAAHRYVFTLIAAGAPLGLGWRFTAEELYDALQGNVLASGQLIGRYGRYELSGPNPPSHSG